MTWSCTKNHHGGGPSFFTSASLMCLGGILPPMTGSKKENRYWWTIDPQHLGAHFFACPLSLESHGWVDEWIIVDQLDWGWWMNCGVSFIQVWLGRLVFSKLFFPNISNSCCVGIVVLGQISRNGPGIFFAGRGACGMGCSHHKWFLGYPSHQAWRFAPKIPQLAVLLPLAWKGDI